jgi:hypothetical protein
MRGRLLAMALIASVTGIAACGDGDQNEQAGDRPAVKQQTQDHRRAVVTPQQERARTRRVARARRRAQARRRADARARRRLARAQRKALARSEPENAPGDDCAEGYDPCVPPYPPDVDCADLSGPYKVSRPDPHRLDPDGDGKAC